MLFLMWVSVDSFEAATNPTVSDGSVFFCCATSSCGPALAAAPADISFKTTNKNKPGWKFIFDKGGSPKNALRCHIYWDEPHPSQPHAQRQSQKEKLTINP
jgi:hypothetical protein